LVALAATVMLETGERGSLSQAADGIQSHFGVSDLWIGALPAAMTLVGVFASIPFGHLADHMRRTFLLAFAMVVWTSVMGLNALAPTFAFLFLTRIAVGIVEANGAASISLLSDYYPVRDRAKRIGLYNSGALVGSALGLGLAGVLVDKWGWRAAFWMWIPFGIATVVMLLRAPEPARGAQDADLAADQADPAAEADTLGSVDATSLADKLDLPAPTRVGTLDYASCTWREAYREIFSIRSMWFGVVGITVSSGLIAGLSFWGVPFLKEAHNLSASAAGGYVIIFGLGAAVGVISGGFVSDRILQRGIVNARIYVVFVSSILATAAFIPAFAATSLAVTLPLFLVGGFFLTLPVAPSDAMVNDVVVPQLRGRASALRSVVRSLAGLMPLIIGGLKGLFGLQTALIIVTPVYAIGGIIVLFAARTYPSDLAFVLAESNRHAHSDNMPAS
jgi:predicted MFS family arabinose efflux permease